MSPSEMTSDLATFTLLDEGGSQKEDRAMRIPVYKGDEPEPDEVISGHWNDPDGTRQDEDGEVSKDEE
jgi:hypothetical protein